MITGKKKFIHRVPLPYGYSPDDLTYDVIGFICKPVPLAVLLNGLLPSVVTAHIEIYDAWCAHAALLSRCGQ